MGGTCSISPVKRTSAARSACSVTADASRSDTAAAAGGVLCVGGHAQRETGDGCSRFGRQERQDPRRLADGDLQHAYGVRVERPRVTGALGAGVRRTRATTS